jgi:hypothetical protein
MRLPAPPADLNDRPLPEVWVEGAFWRLWRDDYASPFFWSKKGLYRFDSRSAPKGVLYTGCTFEAAVVEVFGDPWREGRKLSAALTARYWVSCLECSGASVVDTTGVGLNRLGMDSMLFASTQYRLTRRWARAFMEHRSRPGGILYHSRKNPQLTNCAFFGPPPDLSDRKRFAAKWGLPEPRRLFELKTADQRLLGHPLFDEVLDKYEIALI